MTVFIEICIGKEVTRRLTIEKGGLNLTQFFFAQFRYQHVALIDLDEFIIPRNNHTLSELLK